MAINSKDPRFQRAFLILLGVGGVLYCFFFTTWLPFTYKASAGQLNTLGAQYVSMTKDLNKARQAAHRLPYLEREYELLHRKWEQGQTLLPEKVDMAWVLRTVTLVGTRAGVEFTLFRPLPAKPAQYHTENPIEIKVVGGYHQVGSFLAEVANLDRIINVSNLEIVTNKDKEADKPAEASFVAETYTLGGTGLAPEQDKKGKGTSDSKESGGRSTKNEAPGAASESPENRTTPRVVHGDSNE